ncbi:MAG: hypothetical protein ACQESC_00355 [Nanobdellota archaeon]
MDDTTSQYNLNEELQTLRESTEFKEWHENNESYKLAHFFMQTDTKQTMAKELQIGFYSEKEDKIASFKINPVRFEGKEKIVKQEGKGVEELKNVDACIPLDKAITIVQEYAKENYPAEPVRTIITILQTIQGTQTYSITAVTERFTMIIIKLDAKDGSILSADKRSVLDLQKN